MADAGHQPKEISLLRGRSGAGTLIQDLKVDFGVNDEGIAIVLHLLDQLYGLRCLVRDIHAMETPDRAKDAG
jgi:chaperone modulatory protein CbpM